MYEYDEIYEELCYRVEEGELSLEDAEIINEAAYDRYIEEKYSEEQKNHLKELKRKHKENMKKYGSYKNIVDKGSDEEYLDSSARNIHHNEQIRKISKYLGPVEMAYGGANSIANLRELNKLKKRYKEEKDPDVKKSLKKA